MAFVVYSTDAPYAGSSARLIVAVEPTGAKAATTAAGNAAWTADATKHDDTVNVGDWWTGAGQHSTNAPDTDANRRKDIVEASVAWAAALCDLLSPGLYIRAGTPNAEARARYYETRIRIISAPAVIQAAAQASWTPTVLRALYHAQTQLMPFDAREVRRWFRVHSYSSTRAAGTWSAAIHPTSGQTIAPLFPPNNTAKEDDTWDPVSDAQTPTAWSAASGGRLAVTMSRQADPYDFSDV